MYSVCIGPYTLLNVFSYYDLSVRPCRLWVSKKVWMGVGGWGKR